MGVFLWARYPCTQQWKGENEEVETLLSCYEHGLSAKQVPVSAYDGSSKNLKDLALPLRSCGQGRVKHASAWFQSTALKWTYM